MIPARSFSLRFVLAPLRHRGARLHFRVQGEDDRSLRRWPRARPDPDCIGGAAHGSLAVRRLPAHGAAELDVPRHLPRRRVHRSGGPAGAVRVRRRTRARQRERHVRRRGRRPQGGRDGDRGAHRADRAHRRALPEVRHQVRARGRERRRPHADGLRGPEGLPRRDRHARLHQLPDVPERLPRLRGVPHLRRGQRPLDQEDGGRRRRRRRETSRAFASAAPPSARRPSGSAARPRQA